jgi:hypothetical protein
VLKGLFLLCKLCRLAEWPRHLFKSLIPHPLPNPTSGTWICSLLNQYSLLEAGGRLTQTRRCNLERGSIPVPIDNIVEWILDRSPSQPSCNGYVNTNFDSNLKEVFERVEATSRLTFTSAEAHDLTKFSEQSAENTLGMLSEEECYNGPINRHCTSKLLNIFWVRGLASRTSRDEVIIIFFNPGAVNTGNV